MHAEKERILIIDDEEVIRDAISRAFVKEGFSVQGAPDGESGCRLFREFRPDIVLVDLKMPGMSGMEVLAEIRNEDPDVIKIVITGYATISLAVDAMKLGAYDFLPKPFTPEELRIVVGRGLEKRRLALETKALKKEQENIRRNMISLVSHELRAPLAASVQFLEVVLGGFAGDISGESKELISRCDTRLREMLELIGKWLRLATFDPDYMVKQFTEINLREIAKKAVDAAGPLEHEKGVNLYLESPGNLPPIQGDEFSLAEIFNNL
ncbi:MAG: hybrid sensor histidine kinase/response regulator, partial [Deltaproteobacteria bacterium]|nr:hybrid sensor histidine kinase/response regulator [Deltaproteobacteria bacterium]